MKFKVGDEVLSILFGKLKRFNVRSIFQCQYRQWSDINYYEDENGDLHAEDSMVFFSEVLEIFGRRK